MADAYATPMRMIALPLIAVAMSGAMAAPGQHRNDQDRAYDARRTGAILPPRAIEQRVIPTMQGYQYLGFELDFGTAVYTLKFLRDGTVVWVDVDGRSGRIIGRTGR